MAECSDSSVSVNNANVPKPRTTPVQSDCAEDEKTDKVLMVEEMRTGLVSESFLVLQRELVENRKSPLSVTDTVFCLVYLLMLEEGFVPCKVDRQDFRVGFHLRQILEMSLSLPADWKRGSDGVYRVEFKLATFPQDVCAIVGVPSQDDLIVNCTTAGEGRYTMLVDCRLFVLEAVGKTFFQNLRTLAINFKNTITYPLKMEIHRKNNCPMATSLRDLPVELKWYLCKFIGISYKDLASILEN